MRKSTGGDPAKLVGGAIALVFLLLVSITAVMKDRRERALLAAGHCTKVMEALYTPPPSAHTSCSGDGASQHCRTWYSQRDPYMRSLWRCIDPDNRCAREFWRRTAEEAQP